MVRNQAAAIQLLAQSSSCVERQDDGSEVLRLGTIS